MHKHRLDDYRHRRARQIAQQQGDVISRPQIYACGITRWEVRAHIRARRWQRIGDQSISLHSGPITEVGWHWAAVFQGGPRARLDGASALIASGLKRYAIDRIRVSVPRGARVRRTRQFNIRQTRRWLADDQLPNGIPRARPAGAAVRAALWATSTRQATLVLTMAVQQGLTTPEDLAAAALLVRRDKRRELVHAVVNDLLSGATTLGEIDFIRECERRGLPMPSQQVLRRDAKGNYFLDVYWSEWGLVVEIDGIHHSWAENVVSDALRQNAIALAGDTVLRLPLLGFRVAPDDFFDQIAQALVQAGCPLVA